MSNGAETPIQDFDAMSLIFPDTSPSNRLPQWAVRRANFTIVKAAVSANANIATLVDIDHACHVGNPTAVDAHLRRPCDCDMGPGHLGCVLRVLTFRLTLRALRCNNHWCRSVPLLNSA